MKTWRRLVAAAELAWFYLGEVLTANLRVARDVLSRRPALAPAIVRVPYGALTERQIVAYAVLLTMTPGTLVLEIDPAARVLLVHTLYAHPSLDTLRAQFRHDYETRIRLVF